MFEVLDPFGQNGQQPRLIQCLHGNHLWESNQSQQGYIFSSSFLSTSLK